MIEHLLTRLNSLLPYDKALHFIGGALIAALLAGFLHPLLTWAVVALIAALKEGYDYLHPPHECSFYDWLATILGGLIPLIPVFITQWK